MPCAGCGLTRAFVALGHGHVHAALDFNLLSPLLFAWMLSWWLLTVMALVRHRPIPPMPIWLVRVAFFGLGGYWLARLIYFAAQPDLLQRMAAASPLIRWLIS
jgi:hypothetical protein